jgi:hypothetical protein
MLQVWGNSVREPSRSFRVQDSYGVDAGPKKKVPGEREGGTRRGNVGVLCLVRIAWLAQIGRLCLLTLISGSERRFVTSFFAFLSAIGGKARNLNLEQPVEKWWIPSTFTENRNLSCLPFVGVAKAGGFL